MSGPLHCVFPYQLRDRSFLPHVHTTGITIAVRHNYNAVINKRESGMDSNSATSFMKIGRLVEKWERLAVIVLSFPIK
jgi:hypothetical protein